MAIEFICRDCGKKYRVRDDAAGKKVKCKECGSVTTVPAGGLYEHFSDDLSVPSTSRKPLPSEESEETEDVEFRCPYCHGTVSAASDLLGKEVECPYCQKDITVVSADAAPAGLDHAEEIKFKCHNCGKKYRVPGDAAGKKVKCKECGAVVKVPPLGDLDGRVEEEAEDFVVRVVERGTGQLPVQGLSDGLQFECPDCRGRIGITADLAGQAVQCPHCLNQVWAPQSAGGPLQQADIVVRLARQSALRTDEAHYAFRMGEELRNLIRQERVVSKVEVDMANGFVANTAALNVRIIEFDFGDRFYRYLFLGITGACKLQVSYDVQDQTGRSIDSGTIKSKGYGGFFGGDSKALMELNAKRASQKLAKKLFKKLYGWRTLLTERKSYGGATLISGLLSLIPFAAFFFTPVTAALAIITFVANRDKPVKAGTTMATIGIVGAMVGVVITLCFLSVPAK